MRNLIIISGYYGFGNLGDEAILEELIDELKRLVPGNQIVVLSANPARTASEFGVKALPRSNFFQLARAAGQARLLVSGGGGLFQDTHSLGSVIFYGSHILLAKLLGCEALIYAQGLGPFRQPAARFITKQVFAGTKAVSVRDQASFELVESWGLPAQLTADPVWCLQDAPLPDKLETVLSELRGGGTNRQELIGLSLRTSPKLSATHLRKLSNLLAETLPDKANLIALPLQKGQDEPVLNQFKDLWLEHGRRLHTINPDDLKRPSQWLTLLGRLDFLVSMRLHALIMAFKSGVPAVGIAYDPKVTRLLTDFEQPVLNLTNEAQENWKEVLQTAFDARAQLSAKAAQKAQSAKKLACQNFMLLSRMLGMQRDA